MIKITDLKGERPTITLPPNEGPVRSSPFDPITREFVRLCTQIEERFNSTIIMRKDVTDEDIQNLDIFDSLLNGKEVNAEATGTISVTKGLYQEIDEHICQGKALDLRMFLPVANYPGHFDLMGARITAPEWGLSTRCELELSDAERETFCKSQPGYVVQAKARNIGRGRFVWKDERAGV